MATGDKLVNLDSLKTAYDTAAKITAPMEASSTASAAHAAGEHFIYNGLLYIATSDIASGATITPGTNCRAVTGGIGEEVSDLKSATDDIGLDLYAMIGRLPMAWEMGGMYNSTGIEYTSTGKIRTGFIEVTPGDKVIIENVPVAGVVYQFASNTTSASGVNERLSATDFTTAGATVTIESSAHYIRIQLSASSVDTGLGLIARTNDCLIYDEIMANGMPAKNTIETGTDFDAVITSGIYFFGGNGQTYTNAPFANPYGGMLLVYKYSNNNITQIAINPDGKQYTRRSTAGTFPAAWYTDETGYHVRGAVATNTDLDTIKDTGIWLLESGRTYTHSPFSSTYGGILLVFKYSNNTVLQIASRAYTGEIYTRESHLGTFPATWALVGDTLTSTGDTTDRTSAIQSLLNLRGVCRLGPGDFYVTGINVPDYGMLIGSGPSTRIILASSVTTGAAVKINNFGCVKDVRIIGSTSDYTPTSTVGTRHGILFEGTSDATTSPVVKENATVENCIITDFAGGGITCNKTGERPNQCIMVSDVHILRCDAGVNVALRSEFDHFTNINATDCYYGCICNGGNCLFSNCNFSTNYVNIWIDGHAGPDAQGKYSYNNAHGVFSCCKVAHALPNNSGIGIKVNNSSTCENFNGISFDYGQIVIDSSNGVQFTGCRFGKNTVIDVDDSTAIIFDACIIRDATTMSATSDNSTTHFISCYDSVTGNLYDPLNEQS